MTSKADRIFYEQHFAPLPSSSTDRPPADKLSIQADRRRSPWCQQVGWYFFSFTESKSSRQLWHIGRHTSREDGSEKDQQGERTALAWRQSTQVLSASILPSPLLALKLKNRGGKNDRESVKFAFFFLHLSSQLVNARMTQLIATLSLLKRASFKCLLANVS